MTYAMSRVIIHAQKDKRCGELGGHDWNEWGAWKERSRVDLGTYTADHYQIRFRTCKRCKKRESQRRDIPRPEPPTQQPQGISGIVQKVNMMSAIVAGTDAALEEAEKIRKSEKPEKEPEISLCSNCFCMTKTIDDKCGKCKAKKETISNNPYDEAHARRHRILMLISELWEKHHSYSFESLQDSFFRLDYTTDEQLEQNLVDALRKEGVEGHG